MSARRSGGEWTNITSRIGWLVTSQSFLFVALVVAGGGQPIAKSALFPLLPLIGLGASLAVFVAVLAALHRIRTLRCSQGKLASLLERNEQAVAVCVDPDGSKGHLRPSSRKVHVRGALPTLVIPVSLLLGWMHVLGHAGFFRITGWIIDPNKANTIILYLVVGGLAMWFWQREVFVEARNLTDDPPNTDPVGLPARPLTAPQGERGIGT